MALILIIIVDLQVFMKQMGAFSGGGGVKIVESKPKSDTRKRSRSESINLKFRLDQRSFDRPTSSSMLPLMEKLASFLSCNLKTGAPRLILLSRIQP
jgi:hypothetical protein